MAKFNSVQNRAETTGPLFKGTKYIHVIRLYMTASDAREVCAEAEERVDYLKTESALSGRSRNQKSVHPEFPAGYFAERLLLTFRTVCE
jgi:hypothetical protein